LTASKRIGATTRCQRRRADASAKHLKRCHLPDPRQKYMSAVEVDAAGAVMAVDKREPRAVAAAVHRATAPPPTRTLCPCRRPLPLSMPPPYCDGCGGQGGERGSHGRRRSRRVAHLVMTSGGNRGNTTCYLRASCEDKKDTNQ